MVHVEEFLPVNLKATTLSHINESKGESGIYPKCRAEPCDVKLESSLDHKEDPDPTEPGKTVTDHSDGATEGESSVNRISPDHVNEKSKLISVHFGDDPVDVHKIPTNEARFDEEQVLETRYTLRTTKTPRSPIVPPTVVTITVVRDDIIDNTGLLTINDADNTLTKD